MLACSDDSSGVSPDVDLSENESSSSVVQAAASSSSVSAAPGASSSSRAQTGASSSSVKVDTPASSGSTGASSDSKNDSPYYTDVDDPFSWDGELPSTTTSSSSVAPAKQSSSSVSSSSSATTPAATVNGDVMTDNRDGKKYKLVMVGEKIWMAENLAYRTATGSYCYDGDCDNILYTFAAIESACPGGWHMPARSEMEALAEEGAEWEYWQFGGRMNGSNFNYSDQMGFWWLSKSAAFKSGDDDNCKSSNCAMLFVQKAPDYGDGENKFQQDDKAKGFSIRCVQN